jgi:carbamoyltransferase
LVEALLAGKLVGVAQGASEWGARALGGRNLYADARSGAALERLGREIKRRESFRGFALAVLAERAGDWLELDPSSSLCARWLSTVVVAKPALCELAPSVVRPDGRVRAHLVDAQGSSELHALLTAFAARSGIPLLVSTSLNQRGDPLTRTATDAFALFDRTSLDLLVVGEELYSR